MKFISTKIANLVMMKINSTEKNSTSCIKLDEFVVLLFVNEINAYIDRIDNKIKSYFMIFLALQMPKTCFDRCNPSREL